MTMNTMASECYSCEQTALPVRPPSEEVWTEPGWRVAHAFSVSLPGWLVLVPTRHVEALDELSTSEAQALGRLLRDASAALRAVTGCLKTYAMLFAEADGFAHLHVHVVPRASNLPLERRGPAVFGYATDAPLGEAERDRTALALRAAWPRT